MDARRRAPGHRPEEPVHDRQLNIPVTLDSKGTDMTEITNLNRDELVAGER